MPRRHPERSKSGAQAPRCAVEGQRPNSSARLVVAVITLAYAALFFGLGAWKYAVHRNLVDFGIFAQTAESAFGCFCNAIEGSHWAFHFSPILYVPAALLAVWNSPLALIALQSVAGALTIPPVYALIARRADRRTALLGAAVAALYPALAGLIFNDFHENVFAPAAIVWMLWAFDGGRLRLAFVFALVAMAVKEDQAIFVAVAGLLGGLRFRGTSAGRTALAAAVVGACVCAFFFRHIQPAALAQAGWQPTRFYAWTAADVRALFFGGIFGRLGFGVLAFLPLLFLPFRSRMMWLAAAPLAEVLFSRMPTTYTIGSHYAGAWIGYVLVAFAFAVRRMDARKARAALLWCIALCVVELAVANPLHPGLNLRAVQPRDGALDRVLAALPANVQIATQEEAFTHLALRDPNATLLPERASDPLGACYALIDTAFPESARLQEYGGALQALVKAGTYVPARRAGAITLFRRRGCAMP